MLEELFKNILDSDVVKKVTKNLGENEIVNKVKEAVAGNDYAKKLQEGLTSGALLDKIKTGAQTAGREATKVSLHTHTLGLADPQELAWGPARVCLGRGGVPWPQLS